jgi:hypothetical protein
VFPLSLTLLTAVGLWGTPAFGAKPALEGLQGLEQIASRFATLADFLKDRAALKEYESVLTRYYGRDKFPCESFTEVLGQLRHWIAANPAIAQRLWAAHPAWQHEARGKGPLANANPHYRFIRAPRNFHGIWEDLSRAGCPSSDCSPPGLATPGRWAGALEHSDLYYVQKGHAFSGTSILLVEIGQGSKKFGLALPSAKSDQKVGDKTLTAALLEDWGKAMTSPTPLVSVDAKGGVKNISNHRSVGELSGFDYRDPDAKKLAFLLPDRCSNSARGLATDNANGMQRLGTRGSQAAQAALKEVVNNLQIGAGASVKNSLGLQGALSSVLKTSVSPNQRAQAALGLDLLKNTSEPAQGSARADYSPSTRGVLVAALQDPSPAVRSQAALALADPGPLSVGNSKGGQSNLPQGTAGWPDSLMPALNQAFRSPAGFAGSPSLRAFASEGAIRGRAFDEMLHQGAPLDPQSKEQMWNEAQNGATPEIRQSATDRIAKQYLAGKPSSEAFKELRGELAQRPDLTDAVLWKIKDDLPKVCYECQQRLIATGH